MAGDTGVVEPDLEVRALAAAEDHGFVPNRAEALDPLDRLDQGFGRGRHVIEQTNRAQIELPSKLEPESIASHGPSHRLDKGDLSFDAQAFVGIVDLRRCQACRLQKRAQVETGSVRFLSRETRQRPGSGGKTRVVWIGLRHGSRKALSDMSMYDNSLARPSKTQRAGAH